MTCANCSKPALYEYKLTLNKSVFYCSAHLPSFLEKRKVAGLLTFTDKYKEEKEFALTALAPSTPEVSTPEEEPKPKKKAAKKKAE